MRIRGLRRWVWALRRTRKRKSKVVDGTPQGDYLCGVFCVLKHGETWYFASMLMKGFPIWVFACLCLSSRLPAQSYPVPAVTYSGDPVFSSRELRAASGVAAGASLDQAGIQAAAQRLNDSGMFATVRFSFNGRELHYELTR